jgi:3-phosphoshikimate 1-carboxyvinyltransferase
MDTTMSFFYRGPISSSKSILNRLLVIQSFASSLEVGGFSACDDVQRMRLALPSILAGRGKPADCGAAGTTFRFLALRASRIPGRHALIGTGKLLARPQGALLEILAQLGVTASFRAEGLVIEGDGWQKPAAGTLRVDRGQSSQFASAVVLSAWDLDFDLELDWLGQGAAEAELAVSDGYLRMTESLALEAGMRLERGARGLAIARGSRVAARKIIAEADLSSCFAVAALASIEGGEAEILNYPEPSLQPDRVFPQILRQMGASVEAGGGRLRARGSPSLRAIDWNLRDCPDLFPVLATLCSLARGRSTLHGAPHLAHKESSRIDATAELIRGLGREVEPRPDGMVVHGLGLSGINPRPWDFDPRDDHRLAMAAALAQLAGSGVRVLSPRVVDKSFPEFWQIAGGRRAPEAK